MRVQPIATRARHREPGERAAIASLWMLAGVPLGIVSLTVWAVFVDTSPTLSDEERVRGWGTVVRELPATLFIVAVPLAGLLVAVRAGRAGAVGRALQAVWLHGAAMVFVLLVVLGGSAENIMETRPSTVKWLLFPIEIGLPALGVWWSRRAVLSSQRR